MPGKKVKGSKVAKKTKVAKTNKVAKVTKVEDDYQSDIDYEDEYQDEIDYEGEAEDAYNDEQIEEESQEEDVDEEDVDNNNDEAMILDKEIKKKLAAKIKKKITDWLNYDDKIKELTAKTKKYKDAKKIQEVSIMEIFEKLDYGESTTINICNDDGTIRSSVYRQKSVTKGAIKEDIIKEALMECLHNEKKVNQLVKKIESKRPIDEKFYLKRTKGNKKNEKLNK